MPHIIIEYSQNRVPDEAVEPLISRAYEAVETTAFFNEENIKVRAHPVAHYRLGLADCGFMHVTCRIHPGKTPEQKRLLTQTLLESLQSQIGTSMVITVEVAEMDKATYAKAVLRI